MNNSVKRILFLVTLSSFFSLQAEYVCVEALLLEHNLQGPFHLECSPGGRRVASFKKANRFEHTKVEFSGVFLWDAKTGSPLATLIGHNRQVMTAAFSSNGQLLATGDRAGVVKIWDMELYACRKTLETKEPVSSLVFSPDDKQLFVGTAWGSLIKYDVVKEKMGNRWVPKRDCDKKKVLLGFSPDGRLLLAGSDDHPLSPDGSLLLTGSEHYHVRLIDINNNQQHSSQYFKPVTAVAFSSDGSLCAAGFEDGVIWVWEGKTLRILYDFRFQDTFVQALCLLPDNVGLIAGLGNGELVCYDFRSKESRQLLKKNSLVTTVHFVPGGQLFAGFSDGSTVLFEDDKSKHLVLRYWPGQSMNFNSPGLYGMMNNFSLVKSRDARSMGLPIAGNRWCESIYFCSGKTEDDQLNKKMECWVNKVVCSLHEEWINSDNEELVNSDNEEDWIHSVCYSPCGNYIVSGACDETVRVWNALTGDCVQIFDDYKSFISSVCYSPCGNYIVSGDDFQEVRVWNLLTGDCMGTFEGHGFYVNSVCYSPCGNYIVSGSSDHEVWVWKAPTGGCVKTFEGHRGAVTSVCYSPCGNYIVSGSEDRRIRVWDVEAGVCVQKMKGHTEAVNSVCYSPCGNYIVSGAADKTVRVWDVKMGVCLREMKGHTKYINSVCYSPCGNYIVSGAADEAVRVWNAITGDCIGRIKHHVFLVWSVAYSPCGNYIISGSLGTIMRSCRLGWFLDPRNTTTLSEEKKLVMKFVERPWLKYEELLREEQELYNKLSYINDLVSQLQACEPWA